MKLATMAVGATAALITGGLVWLAVREEKPAAKTTGSGGATKTTPVGSTHVKYLPVKYPNANANGTDLSIFFNDQIEVFGDTQQFSQGGDSGSVVFDQANRAVGLLFAGIDPSTNNPLASMINLKQASEAQDKLGPKLMVEPWFRGIAVLADDAGSHYLKVNVEAVTEAVRAKLPADVDGVPIRIDAIGDPHPV